MLSDQRKYEIEQIICREGRAYVRELAERFGVSDETIRRDISAISANKRVRKVHGGAVAVRHASPEASYSVRRSKNTEIKLAIGRLAAQKVQDNDIIGINAGTTGEALASEIFAVKNVRIITNSLPIASILAQKKHAGDFDGEIILLGGEVDAETQTIFGMGTVSALQHYLINKAFVSVTAVSPAGVMMWRESDGIFSEQLIKLSEKKYIISESDKIGENSFYKACGLEDADCLITDGVHPIGGAMQSVLEGCGIAVEIAAVGAEQ